LWVPSYPTVFFFVRCGKYLIYWTEFDSKENCFFLSLWTGQGIKKLHVIEWNNVINEIHTTCVPVNFSWFTCRINYEVKLNAQTEEGTEMLDLCCEWTWLVLQEDTRVSFWGWSIRESNCGNVGHRMMYIQWDQSLNVAMFLWRLWYFSHSWVMEVEAFDLCKDRMGIWNRWGIVEPWFTIYTRSLNLESWYFNYTFVVIICYRLLNWRDRRNLQRTSICIS
jgi:hypothetical protein